VTGAGEGDTITIQEDWRVRVSLPPDSKLFYKAGDTNAGIMKPLIDTQGAIFPYTPQIAVTHEAQYDSTQLTHSNYTNYFYKASQVQAITISGDFTVQNIKDGEYLLAVIYFFRSISKMFFGKSQNAGNPPAIVYLNGYGSHYFPNIPCILTQFTHTLPPETDYVAIPVTYSEFRESSIRNDDEGNPIPSTTVGTTKGSTTRLPTTSTISITLQPIYSRSRLHNDYDLNSIARGDLLANKGGFI
jgi:hypothetical protein